MILCLAQPDAMVSKGLIEFQLPAVLNEDHLNTPYIAKNSMELATDKQHKTKIDCELLADILDSVFFDIHRYRLNQGAHGQLNETAFTF